MIVTLTLRFIYEHMIQTSQNILPGFYICVLGVWILSSLMTLDELNICAAAEVWMCETLHFLFSGLFIPSRTSNRASEPAGFPGERWIL